MNNQSNHEEISNIKDYKHRTNTNIEIRLLARSELDRIREIDRSEHVTGIYVIEKGNLRFIPQDNYVPNWTEEQHQTHIKMLAPKLQGEGKLIGALDDEKLVGVAVLGNDWLDEEKTMLQMAFLYVSNSYRGLGIARKLMDQICLHARTRGALQIYVSATETISAVHFYQRYGCKLVDQVHPELFALEPLDIHMVLEL